MYIYIYGVEVLAAKTMVMMKVTMLSPNEHRRRQGAGGHNTDLPLARSSFEARLALAGRRHSNARPHVGALGHGVRRIGIRSGISASHDREKTRILREWWHGFRFERSDLCRGSGT